MSDKNIFGKLLLVILLIGCLLCLTMSTVSAVDVHNYDELNSNLTVGNNVTLKNDISGDQFGQGIIIDKNVTVDGANYCIDANQSGRIFYINNTNVVLTLINITLKNGNNNFGGAIYGIDIVNLNCEGNVLFNNNVVSDEGGAIYAGGDVTITATNVEFSNNKAFKNDGGAIRANGEVIIKSINDIIFENNFANSFATLSGGASISAYKNTSNQFTYFNVILISENGKIYFSNNIVGANGGAIFADNVNITANSIKFNNNAANNVGGAIYAECNVTIIAKSGDILFDNNSAIGSGGAIYAGNAVNIVAGSVSFINNIAEGEDVGSGGAIFANDDVFINVTNEDVIFNNNKASDGGGAIFTNDNLIIVCTNGDVTFINNNVFNNGGAIFAGTAVSINAFDGDVTFINNNDVFWGGAIFAGMDVVITVINGGVTFINNAAEYNGGAIATSNGNVYITADGNVIFYNNTIGENGSAIFADKDVFITTTNGDVTFNNNEGNWVSGAVAAENVNITCNNGNVNFINNKVLNGEGACLYVTQHAYINANILIGINNTAKDLFNGASFKTNDGYIKFNNELIKCSDLGQYYIFYKSTIVLTANNLTKYYGSSDSFTVELKNGSTPLEGKTIKIELNGEVYEKITDSNGIASLNIKFCPGYYPVTTSYEDFTSNATIKVLSTIEANNITKIYKNDTQYLAKFLDNKGNLLTNTEVSFNINGVFYKRTTDSKGVARLNINLNAGEYILTAINPINSQMYSNTITVLSSIEGEDITKIYKNDTQYKATFYNSDGSLLRNTEVQFNINGVFYTRTTDNYGVATMSINLNPATYIITAINPINGERHSNNIIVLPIIIANDLTMKYHDGSKFTAKLIDGSGQPVVGNELKFNVNGVFYYKITDSEGMARLTINLNPGDYIITSEYGGFMTSNEIHITE